MSIQSDPYLDQLDTWHKLVTKEKEQYKTFADAIQVFLPVSAFIAGVQAQIVTLTIRLPVTPLGRAANLFGFVGLIFDINGTIAGVYDTLFVQGQTRELTAILAYNSDLQKQVNDFKKASEGTSKEDRSKFEEQFKSFSEEMMKRYPLGKLRPTSWISYYFIAEHVLPTSTSNPWLLLIKPFRALFLMPAQTMLFGIAALKLSIILLAGASMDLQREVWICCLVIFSSSMTRLVLHALVPQLTEMRRKRKADANP